jgi:hypothetical protein
VRASQSGVASVLLADWNRFFFTPADPRPLGLIRIAVGALLAWNWIWLGTDLTSTLGASGWADPETARSLWRPGAWSLWHWVPDQALLVVWIIGLISIICLTLGLVTRVAAWVAWAFLLSTMRRAPVLLFGFDNVMAIWSFYLAVSCAGGQAYSLDAFWRARALKTARGLALREPSLSVPANLGLRLIQLHLCLIYASAGLAKLQGTPWWDGTAVGMLLGNSDFRPFDLSFLAEHPRVLELATHATVGFELLYAVLIWIRRFRPWLLVFAVLIHGGIAISMGLTEFSLAMLAGNLAFLEPRWIDGCGRAFVRLHGRKRLEYKPGPQAQPSGDVVARKFSKSSTGARRDQSR